ncbi:LysR family transcriptional regulator [Buttiauxella agrestis]
MAGNKSTGFDYNLIKVMNEVIISGSLSRAAKNLNISVSAVSLLINKLKLHLGDNLLYRTTQGLKPTPMALEIHDSFVKAIAIIEDVMHCNKIGQRNDSPLRIICSDVTEDYYFNELSQFEDELVCPFEFANHLVFSDEDLTQYLLQSKIDVVVGQTCLADDRVVNQKIDSVDDFVIICGANSLLAHQKEITLTHYYSFPHVEYNCRLAQKNKETFSQVHSVDVPYSGVVKKRYSSSSIDSVIKAVENSDMLALFPRKFAEHFIKNRGRCIVIAELPSGLIARKTDLYISYLSSNVKEDEIKKIASYLMQMSCCK